MHKNDRIMMATGVIIMIIAFGLAFVLATPKVLDGGGPPPPPPEPEKGNMTLTQSGAAQENSESAFEEDLISPIWINLTLTWTDEPDTNNRFTNAPDQFGLKLEGPDGQEDETSLSSNTHDPQGGEGSVSLNYQVDHGETNWTAGNGAWNIVIVCGECGNQKPILSPFGLREQNDNGNSWELTIDIVYYIPDEEEGGEES